MYQKSEIQSLQMQQMFSTSNASLATSTLLAAILAYVLHGVIASSVVFAWLSLIVLLTLFRAALVVYYLRSPVDEYPATHARIVSYRLGVIVSGCIWGSASLLMFPANDSAHQLFLVFLLAGLTAGGVVSYSADLVSTIGFSVSTLVPLVIRLLVVGDSLSIAMGIAIALYLGFMILSGRIANRHINDNIVLRLEAFSRENDIRESENRYRLLLRHSPVGVFHYNNDLIISYCNENFATILKSTVDRIVGLDMSTLKDTSVLPPLKIALEGEITHYEGHYLATLSDAKGWIAVSCAPSRDDNGHIVGGIAIVQDITERKHAELALKRESEKNRALLQTASDGMHILDSEGYVIEVSDSFCEMMGYRRDEMIGMNVSRWDAKLSSTEITQKISQLFARRERTRFETINRRKDGTLFDAEVSVVPLELEGKPVLFNASRDITERKRAEMDLQISEQRLRTIIETEPECIKVVDSKGRLLEMNAAGLAMLEVDSLKEAQQQSLLNYIDPEYQDAFMSLHQRVMNGESGVLEFKIRGLKGTPRYLETHATPMRDSNGDVTLLLGITRDVTEHKRAGQTEKRLSRAFRLLSRCGSTLAHAKKEQELLTDICQLTVDTGGYLMAWVGFAEHDVDKTVRPVGQSGYEEGYLDSVNVKWADTARGRGPVGTAIREGVTVVIQDFHTNPKMAPWREAATTRGYNSCLALPLVVNKQAIGALAIYSTEPFAFGKEEVELLEQLANDLSYGIETLRARVEHEVAQTALKEESEKSLALLHNASDGIHILDTEGNVIEASDSFCIMLGYQRDEVIGMNVSRWDAKFKDAKLTEVVKQLFAQKGRSQFETLHLRKDGTIFDVEVSSFPLELSGRTVLFCSSRDITERKIHENLIHENELRLLSILNASPIAVRIATNKGREVVFYNRSYAELIKNTHAEGDDPKKYYARPADYEEVLAELARGNSVINRPIELDIPDESTMWVLASYMPMQYQDEDAVLGWFYDITERKQAEENLRITASVFDNTQEAIVITDANNVIIDVNPAFTHITGYSREEALGNNPKILSSGRQSKLFYSEMWQLLKKNKAWRGEIWNRRKSGEVYAEQFSISAVCDDKGNVMRYVGVFSDISHLKAHEAELDHIAHYDALTGIPNRLLLADRMKQAIAQTSREQHMMAVCYFDLDGFKPINDTLGHEAGDQVLIEVANRIGNTIRGGDTVARLGGDEFVVLLLGLEKGNECVATLERLLAAIAQPITVKNKSSTISASIGVSIYPLDEEDPDTLLRHADQAMYVAKQSGKNRYHIYDPALDKRARDQNEFLKSIRHALEHDQFELLYQPKVNLRTQELVGAEALIRWRHPERGLLSPAEFLRHVENTDLDIKIGEWVTATALAQIDHWLSQGLDIVVSINISGYHLESSRFTERLQQQLAHYPSIPSGKLQIEVLETVALNDIAIVRGIIESCRKLGVGFALDDFGTGYSSLSYLSKLPVDVLKIDQSFVRDMLEDKGDMAIVQGIIALARAFDRKTVAEGIETRDHYLVLLEMGCEVGQGYGIARPMPANEITSWQANFRV